MGSPDDYFVEKTGKALVACAELRDLIPAEWEQNVQERVRRDIAVAMGLLQHPEMVVCVTHDRGALRRDAQVVDVDLGGLPTQEKSLRTTASRLTAYASLTHRLLEKVPKLLDSPDGQYYAAKLLAKDREHFARGTEAVRAVLNAVGDDGIFPWL